MSATRKSQGCFAQDPCGVLGEAAVLRYCTCDSFVKALNVLCVAGDGLQPSLQVSV